jgi:hypothetical protein
MAKVSAFGYTNTTSGTHDVTPKLLGLTSNYSLSEDQADVVKLNNKTAPIDQEELISFRSRTGQRLATDLNIQYPSPVNNVIEYSVRVDEVLSTTDTENPNFRVDEPIVCSIAFRHPKSGNIGKDQVAEVFVRAISALMKTDGSWRFDDLMRSAERPVVD